jgi:Ca-activated chloride channel family protein
MLRGVGAVAPATQEIPMSPSVTPSARHARAVLLSLLIAATLAAGVAARVLGQRPVPLPGPGAGSGASAGALRVTAALDRSSVLQGGDGVVRALLTLQGRAGDPGATAKSLPTDLIVILDNSGSMSGEPLFFAKAAVRELVAGLRTDDRFALVRYASDASVAIPLTPAGPAARPGFEAAIEAIGPEGGTHLSAGLDLAHEVAARTSRGGRALRVILLSDGHANEGDFSFEGLRARAHRAVSQEYVLSAVGVGQGFDEALMGAIADAGTGNFYYLPDVRELAGIFAGEFASARETVASGLKVALAPAPGVEVIDAAGYPLERDGARVTFRPGDLYAGQERRIWLTLRAPTDRAASLGLGDLALAWREPSGTEGSLPHVALPQLACVADETAYYASFDRALNQSANQEALGALKERVAEEMRNGRQDAAITQLYDFRSRFSDEQTKAFGAVAPEARAELDALDASISAPAAASPAEQQRLGKDLLQDGRDRRRAGAKYSK